MAEKFRYIGVTDECIECQRCGKVDLKSTVVLAVLDADGNEEDITYYGSSCAGRALAIKATGKQVKAMALNAHRETLMAAKDAREMLAYYGIPESGEVSVSQMATAVKLYREAHWDRWNSPAHWCYSVTPGGWRDMVNDMIARKRAAIREAALLGY